MRCKIGRGKREKNDRIRFFYGIDFLGVQKVSINDECV